jgi:hypothetical protein
MVPGALTAPGATLTAPPEAPRAGHHHCKCRMCRGDSSCCCARREAESSEPSGPSHHLAGAVKPEADAEPDGGPCLSSIPCGSDPWIPSAAPRPGFSKAIGAEASSPAVANVRGALLPCLPQSLRSACLAARLDDPPEGVGSV